MFKKTLIQIPSPNLSGGISSYYQAIRPHLGDSFRFMIRGRRFRLRYFDKFVLVSCYIFDFSNYIFRLPFIDKLLINHSLSREAIYRDAGFILIAKLLGKKTIVFFRGIDPIMQDKIEKGNYPLFQKVILKADKIIVLSSTFKDKLISWGYTRKIYIETTVVDDFLIKYDQNVKAKVCSNLLFLSRVEKYKGIFELISAFECLQKERSDIQLTIAGEGEALASIKKMITEKPIKNIQLPGHVIGKEKARAFSNADIFILPSYAEGMPNALLEAMAFGLPIITTSVGGIPDFFEDGKMGFLLDNTKPEHIKQKINALLRNRPLMEEISEFNLKYAKQKFYASIVAKRLESVINE